MYLSVVAATFSTIALTEFGDKTQVTTLNLSTGGRLLPIFLGCLLGVLAGRMRQESRTSKVSKDRLINPLRIVWSAVHPFVNNWDLNPLEE